jgi:hypothetical protein
VGVSHAESSSEIPVFVAGLGVVARKAHPLVVTSRMIRKPARIPHLYIDNV